MSIRTGDGKTLSKPKNVEQVVSIAESFEYNPLIPLKYWLRTATTILKEAEIYEHEGNDEQTYMLLYRHAQLVIKHLSTSPDAKTPQNRAALVQAHKEVQRNLQKLEILKPRINKKYERYEQLMRERDARRAATAAAPRNSRASTPTGHKRGLSDPAISDGTEALAAGENKDLAIQLANKEFKRRALARKPTRQAGISEKVEHERRTAGGVWGDWEEAFTKNNDTLDRNTLSQQMQNVRSQLNGTSDDGPQRRDSKHLIEGLKSKYSYPTVPDRVRDNAPDVQPPPLTTSFEPLQEEKPPEPPPKNSDDSLHSKASRPPKRPQKTPLDLSNGHSVKESLPSSPSTEPQQELKPSEFLFKPAAYLENGSPLRTIFLPPGLRHDFLDIASSNTRANKETCGILCGTLMSNALFISKLVIPEQESTSDTCEMVNESALFDYVDGEDLLVLGWIHTHPTQTCFMSSRDLHTHGGYQVMLPESIAIVCAPSRGEWGVFRLTDPPGMKTVLNCTKTGLFHPHDENNIYTDALRPGHVVDLKGLGFEVVDLRP